MSAKYKKSEVFTYFTKVSGEFLARSHTISLNKGLLNASSHLCVHVWKNTWESTMWFAFFVWFSWQRC